MIKNVGTIWEEKELTEETERNKWRCDEEGLQVLLVQ